MEELTITNEIKRTRGRPRKPDDEKKQRPEKYDINYYHNSKYSNTIKCDKCNSEITFAKLSRHQKTTMCKRRSLTFYSTLET